MFRKSFLAAAISILVIGAGVAYAGRQRLSQIIAEATKPAIPIALEAGSFPRETATSTLPTDAGTTTTPEGSLPSKINLAVPFTVQAPHADWDQPYQDGCEEASAAMVHYFYAKKKFADADAADAELKRLFTWEDETFGSNKDTTAAETARMLREYYGYERVEVRYDVTAEDIRKELRAGRPVIIPAYGKALKNPNFKNGGPVYHMLVIKGYIGQDSFITDDPGTRNGADYVYSVKTIMGALHDWNGGDVQNGRKAMIVVYPN